MNAITPGRPFSQPAVATFADLVRAGRRINTEIRDGRLTPKYPELLIPAPPGGWKMEWPFIEGEV